MCLRSLWQLFGEYSVCRSEEVRPVPRLLLHQPKLDPFKIPLNILCFLKFAYSYQFSFYIFLVTPVFLLLVIT